jgi:hypothetical protein
MIGFYIFVIIILFLLGGLLTFLHHPTKINKPKDGWRKFEEDD